MKIKRIKRLIESLNPSEIKQLNTLLETPFSEDSEYGKKKKISDIGLELYNVGEIVEMIREGDLEETEAALSQQGENGWSVAHELANDSDRTKWFTEDRRILLLQEDEFGATVAHVLAYQHPTWTTDDPRILMVKDKEGATVESILREKGKNIINNLK